MKYQEEHIEQIIARYLSGRMTANEEADFLRFVAESPNLSKKIDSERLLRQALIEDELLELRTQITKDLHHQRRISHFWKFAGWGFGIVFVVGALVFQLNKSNEKAYLTIQSPTIVQETESQSQANINKAIEETGYPTTKNINPPSAQNSTVKQLETNHRLEMSKAIPTEVVVPMEGQSNKKDEKDNGGDAFMQNFQRGSEKKYKANCDGFEPVYTLSTEPSYRGLDNGFIQFRPKNEKLVFWLEKDSMQRGQQFLHVYAGRYRYFVKNDAGCIKGPMEIVVQNTYCLPDDFPKHYKSQGNYIPDVHADAASVVVYDKQNRIIADLQKISQFTWDIQSGVPTGLYLIEALYPNGEKCRVSLTLFE